MYISRTLIETEQRYSNIEHELLAVVFALERLNHYTAGYRVVVNKDSKYKLHFVLSARGSTALELRIRHNLEIDTV